MASCKCGDGVSLKMTFSGWQGDKSALVVLNRLPSDALKTFTLDVKNADVEVLWPDLEKGTSYCGGAKAYLADLPAPYSSKWSHQDYDFDVIVENQKKSSGPITIEREPDKGLKTVSPRVPYILYYRTLGGLMGLLGAGKIPKVIQSKPKTGTANMGRFDIEFTGGEVVITVALEIVAATSGLPPDLFDRFKNTVETFWNGPKGFRGAALHRKKCVRADKCDCPIEYDASGALVTGGCCKYPVRLVVESGSRHAMGFNVYAEGFFASAFGDGAYMMDPGTGLGRVGYPERPKNTWAHEVGHCIGFPDQYLGGHMWRNHPDGKFPVKVASIMGMGQRRADKDHLHHAEKFMGADFTSMDHPPS